MSFVICPLKIKVSKVTTTLPVTRGNAGCEARRRWDARSGSRIPSAPLPAGPPASRRVQPEVIYLNASPKQACVFWNQLPSRSCTAARPEPRFSAPDLAPGVSGRRLPLPPVPGASQSSDWMPHAHADVLTRAYMHAPACAQNHIGVHAHAQDTGYFQGVA